MEVHRQNRHRFGWQAVLLYGYLSAIRADIPWGFVMLRRLTDGSWGYMRHAVRVVTATPVTLQVVHCCLSEEDVDREHGRWHNALVVTNGDGVATALPMSPAPRGCVPRPCSRPRTACEA